MNQHPIARIIIIDPLIWDNLSAIDKQGLQPQPSKDGRVLNNLITEQIAVNQKIVITCQEEILAAVHQQTPQAAIEIWDTNLVQDSDVVVLVVRQMQEDRPFVVSKAYCQK